MKKSKVETAETRRRIVETAAREFRRKGIHPTGLADVMAAADLTHGGFYRHFGSKDQLVAEACAAALELVVEKTEAAACRRKGKGGLEAIIESYLSTNHPDDRANGCPLAALGSGTILNGRADVFRTIVAGVAKHKGTQLVLSIGDQLDPKEIGPVPNNAIIVNKAPQLEILKRTSVCITHAGLNTVLESLAHGVPELAIPVTFEQPGVAARIAAKKTGLTMSFADLTSKHLSTLLEEVLNNPIYRENAGKFQEIISKRNGLAMAADIVERALGCRP